jgi:hypothetical protein
MPHPALSEFALPGRFERIEDWRGRVARVPNKKVRYAVAESN